MPSALDVARRALELCDEYPERTADCSYLRYDIDDEVTGTNCIFGTALIDLGVDPDWLRQHEDVSIDSILNDLSGENLRGSDLGEAQHQQDCGLEWGSPPVREPIARFVQVNS